MTHAILDNIHKASAQRGLENVGRHPHLACLNIQVEVTGINLSKVFRTPTNLRTLIISSATNVHTEHFFKLLHNCTRLEHLEAYVVSPRGISDVNWPAEMPNLRIISLVTSTSFRPRQLGEGMLLDLPGISHVCFAL